MKLRYKRQRFQIEAAKAVTDIFSGQPRISGTEYDFDESPRGGKLSEYGYANNPVVLNNAVLSDNLRRVQMEQGLEPGTLLDAKDIRLNIEMETGTGKTFTYIKTMYELNRLYGWRKFIIVVPSVAIREGVLKTFQTTEDHFAQEYGQRMQYFVYNSRQLSRIDPFATDSGMHCMIINMQAFNRSFDKDSKSKESLRIFEICDDFGGRRPIDVISKTNPIMIIDEPQSVLGADKKTKTRKNIALFNPLFLLLYSATHRQDDIYNMVYRLDAMDAYNMHLVKKIEVKGITQIGTTATNGYLYLEEIIISENNPKARICFDVKTATGVRQTTRIAGEGFDIYRHSGNLAEYEDRFTVRRIDGRNGTIELLNGITLSEGDTVGAVTEDALRRIQIRETIRSHLERERDLYAKGIKVLSLFFIDHVENYRKYGEGTSVPGKYAEMFEQEYDSILKENLSGYTPEYARYLQRWKACQVHQGYFSQDKKGRYIDSKIDRNTDSSADVSAYDLIMRDKERLLSFEEPVRFIFSHSALKEGWDNPNVFQICTLKDTSNETKKRQEVGRGMRLCVDKNGERQDADVLGDHVFDTNILTIIASESYDSFAKALQADIAQTVADRPRLVSPELFVNMSYANNDNSTKTIGAEEANKIFIQLVKRDYVDDAGKLTAKYHDDKRSGSIDLGNTLQQQLPALLKRLDRLYIPEDALPPNGRKNRRIAKFDKEKFYKSRFAELWKRINVRSFYTVDFSSDELIATAIDNINKYLDVTKIHIAVEHGSMEKITGKDDLYEGNCMACDYSNPYNVTEAISSGIRYDLIGKLVSATGLKRQTIISILKGIRAEKFNCFRSNPEEFIIKAGKIINNSKATTVVDKITYHTETGTYSSDIFTGSTIRGTVGVNAFESKKSLYDIVVVDSMVTEMEFAKNLERETDVEVFTKLPRDFYINTPMGKYNPDWAVVFREGSVKHVYFIAETKGKEQTELQTNIRGVENCKIECARRHFSALSEALRNNQDPEALTVSYDVVKTYKELYDKVAQP